jgi:hypothetical protein
MGDVEPSFMVSGLTAPVHFRRAIVPSLSLAMRGPGGGFTMP